MDRTSLRALPLHLVASLVRSRSVSPLEVTQATLDAIHEVEPALNAFVTISEEQALECARKLTASPPVGALHGIPVALKDNIDTAGVATTAGSPLFAGRVPSANAPAWERLADAGAVLIGKNNLWELAFGGPHPQFGPTWNPWGNARTAGGTSSGSAASVAAGLSFASLGTDTGGSARVPASLCGLVSLKPTFGLVPRGGVLPVSYTMDHICPITREVRDAALVLAALAGDSEATSNDVLEKGLSGITLGVVRPQGQHAVADDVGASLEEALAVLAREGAKLRTVELPDPEIAGTTARVIMDSEAADLHRERLRTRADSFGRVAFNRLLAAEFIPASAYVRAQRVRRKITDEVEAVLRTVDAIVLPAVGVTAFSVAEDGFEVAGGGGSMLKLLGRFTPLVNATGHPAVVIPCGLGADGMPVSMQLIGRFRGDLALLAIARAFERATQWHTLVPVQAPLAG